MVPDKLFFTSDLHFGHENIIKYCDRPFVDVDCMRDELVRRWNEKIPKRGAEVFILGDVALKLSVPEVVKLLRKLNGHKYLIAGNHDDRLRKHIEFFQQFAWIKDYHEIRVNDQGKKQRIILSHYPMVTWNCRKYKSWMLHGHTHGEMGRDYTNPGRVDVGVDANAFTPVSYEEVKLKIQQRSILRSNNE